MIALIAGEVPDWRAALEARLYPVLGELAARVVWIPQQSTADYLTLLRDAHVAIDTFHFGGGISCMDTYAAGVPMVTLEGDSFRARQGAVCARVVGVPECVATSVEEFIRITCTIARDEALRGNRGGCVRHQPAERGDHHVGLQQFVAIQLRLRRKEVRIHRAAGNQHVGGDAGLGRRRQIAKLRPVRRQRRDNPPHGSPALHWLDLHRHHVPDLERAHVGDTQPPDYVRDPGSGAEGEEHPEENGDPLERLRLRARDVREGDGQGEGDDAFGRAQIRQIALLLFFGAEFCNRRSAQADVRRDGQRGAGADVPGDG